MKKLMMICLLSSIQLVATAQQKWFTLFTDSASLVNEGSKITNQFIKDIKKLTPAIEFNAKAVLNTTPYLIYYDDRDITANLPIWEQVIPDQKQFFYGLAGNETDGKKAFGLFFNGFYLPHELGHAFQHAVEKKVGLSYNSEYLANTIAILWWRKVGQQKALADCYESAKTFWNKLPNPVPAGMTMEEYFTKNYEKATQDPFVYGYMQFKQFMMVYEDQSLPDFDAFILNYINQNKK